MLSQQECCEGDDHQGGELHQRDCLGQFQGLERGEEERGDREQEPAAQELLAQVRGSSAPRTWAS
ncbi:MAG: hypothetical protein AAFN17_16070, partial [Pseudomonadota bacterium]